METNPVKDPLAVANKSVSVRTSRITRMGVTHYPTAACAAGVRTFLICLATDAVACATSSIIQQKNYFDYMVYTFLLA